MLRREGYEVEVAATGHDALQTFDRSGADLVLLDLMLPGLSGTEVCRELRSRSHVPIIMVTARDTEVDKVVGLELGADDYVTKPFSSREPVARIRAVLRRGAQPEELRLNVVEAGPGRVDGRRPRVTVHGPRPPRADAGQLVVGLLAEQRSELRRVGHVHRLAADVRLWRRRAVPVEVVAALAPAAPVELGDRAAQDPGAVRAVDPLLLAAN